MAVRNESVRLSLQDDFSTGMAKAAAQTALLRRELDRLGKVSVQSSRVNRDIDAVAKSANQADSSINQLTGRLRLFADLALTLGPALAPIGAVGIAGIAGLANQLGIAALAGGTAMAAFQGFGDALGAMNDAQLEPTAKNIEKARQAMNDLSPATQEAVLAVQDLIPALKEVRDGAAEGLMPGFTEGIENLDPVLERTESLMNALGQTMGDTFAGGVESLGSARWADFFSFLEREGPATLGDLSSVIGDMAHGLSELWEGFAPLNRDFSSWLVGVGDSFDGWASGLSQTEGFQEFIAYVRESGPQVADTFSAIGGALVDIATAAAPLGGTALAALEAVANLISSVADSDAGTTLLGVAAGLTAINRAMSLTGASAGAGMFGGITAGAKGAKSSLGSFRSDMAAIGDSMVAFGSNADRTAAATERMRGRLASVGKAGAGIGALAVASSGLGEEMGVANMAVLGLTGMMFGPWGAAIGAGVGALIDMTSAGDDAAQSQDGLTATLRSGITDFEALQGVMRDSQALADGYVDSLGLLGQAWHGWDQILTGESQADTIRENDEANQDYFRNLSGGMQNVGMALGESFTDDMGRNLIPTMSQLTDIAERAAPAMQALGITADELANMDPAGQREAAAAIRDWVIEADSAAGRTRNVASAFADLGNEALSTADSASQLSAALQALLGPGLNASAATDAFEGSLRNLEDSLAKNSRSLKGFSDGALTNREAFRGLATDATNMLTAMAENGAGPERLARSLQRSRDRIIEFGTAAGFSRKEINGFLNQIGLTPAVVRTVLKAQGFTDAEIKAMRLREAYNGLPKNVKTALRTDGIPKSMGDVRSLQRQYDLTPAQVKTLVNLMDEAARTGINNIAALLRALDGRTANTSVNNTITTTYVTRRVNENTGLGPAGFGVASGGVIDYYASGDIRNRHAAQIAPAGAWRVWAEDETGGEAYIPLANDWRRNRAVSIWQETGRRLGQFAEGGLLAARMPAAVGGGGSVSVAAPNVSVGGAAIRVFIGDQEVRAIVRQEQSAQSRWDREQELR